jgi:hypothetical protein
VTRKSQKQLRVDVLTTSRKLSENERHTGLRELCKNVIYADDGVLEFTEQERSDCTQESQTSKPYIKNPALLRPVASLLFCNSVASKKLKHAN